MKQLPPITPASGRITLAGAELAFVSAGHGPPLLLLHGWGGSARYWQSTLARLAQQYTVYACDLPGHGASPPLNEAATSERFAELVLAFADAHGLAQFDLNGHSFSAGVAAFVAARQPDRVRRLVLTCFSTFRDERERRVVERIHHVMSLWLALRRPWMAQRRWFYRTVARRFFYRLPSDDALLAANLADFLATDRRTALETARSASNPAITAALRAIQVPTLVVGARRDQVMPPPGTPVVADLIPAARLVWIERCGHLPMIERPDVYLPLLEAFLNRDSVHIALEEKNDY